MKQTNLFLLKKLTVFFIVGVFLVSNVVAQSVTVTGADTGKDTTTQIILTSKTGMPVDIYQFTAPKTTNFLCIAPAELTLDKGTITFLAGKPGNKTSAPFIVNATGGMQRYEIRPPRPSLYTAGLITSIIGGVGVGCAFVVIGLSLSGIVTPGLAPYWGIIGFSLLECASVPMMLCGKAKVKLIEIKF